MIVQGNKIQILVDAQVALQDITNTGEVIQQTCANMSDMQKEFEKRIAVQTQQAIADALAQYEVQENFRKLKETVELVITQKEKEQELMLLKMDTVVGTVSEFCKHFEMAHKQTGEKAIQTDAKCQVATFMSSSATPKRKIKHASLKGDSSYPNKYTVAVGKEGLIESQEKLVSSSRARKERDFTQLFSGLQAQLLQAFTTLTTIMEKSFGDLSETYTTAMQCITNLHKDNTQQIVDHVNANKECLKYLFVHQEELGSDLQNKMDTLLSSSQLIIKDFEDLKQPTDPKCGKLSKGIN